MTLGLSLCFALYRAVNLVHLGNTSIYVQISQNYSYVQQKMCNQHDSAAVKEQIPLEIVQILLNWRPLIKPRS